MANQYVHFEALENQCDNFSCCRAANRTTIIVSSRNFILGGGGGGGGGGKLTDHVAIRPRHGEGRLHNYARHGEGRLHNYAISWGGGGGGGEVGSVWGGSWVILGRGGGGGELSCLKGKLPPLDETLTTY